MDDIPKIGESGHYGLESMKDTVGPNGKRIQGLASLNQQITKKVRLKVLQGRFDPDYRDGPMIRKFKESGLTPEEFLETWKG